MKKFIAIPLMVLATGCTSYTHSERINDDSFYAIGHFNILGIYNGLIKRCETKKYGELVCVDASKPKIKDEKMIKKSKKRLKKRK